MREEIKKLLKEYEKYAKKNGICLNPDKKVVEFLLNGILEKEKKYGKRYCPCRRITGKKEEDEKFICPCVYCKKEIKKYSHCHCFLFVKCNEKEIKKKEEFRETF